jgi:hypothetical protein
MDEFERRVTLALEKMTNNHLISGQKAVAGLIANCLKNDNGDKLINCSDMARGIWVYKDQNGNEVRDYKASKIASAVKPIASVKADELIDKQSEKLDDLINFQDYNSRYDQLIRMEKEDIEIQKTLPKDSKEYEAIERSRTNRFAHFKENEVQKDKLYEKYGGNLNGDVLDHVEYNNKLKTGKKEIDSMDVDCSKFSTTLLTVLK